MDYLIMFVAGMLGVILHALIKIQGINKRMPSQNFKSVLGEYWKTDWPAFFISIFFVLGCVFVSKEILKANTEDLPKTITDTILFRIQDNVRISFIAVGFMADSLLYLWLGRAEKKLRKKVEDDEAEQLNTNTKTE